MRKILALSLCFASLLAAPAFAQDVAPEPATGFTAKPPVHAARHMVVSGNRLASLAGDAMLEQGGNAVDAAIATALALNVVEPQASGIGGGGFMLFYDKGAGKTYAYDGRETAPAAATPDMFLDEGGKPYPYTDILKGGLSVGTPGLLRMCEAAHKAGGKLPWKDLFAPAVALAEHGYALSSRVRAEIVFAPYIAGTPEARELFFEKNGAIKPVGAVITNPQFAKTLRLIADKGADAFYRGDVAKEIVEKVRHNAFRPGRLTEKDLADYRAEERTPLCDAYRDARICAAPPPASGGLAVLQALKLTERFNLRTLPFQDPKAVHIAVDALRLAFADRNAYVADCDAVPAKAMLDSRYVKKRSALISESRSITSPAPGRFSGAERCGKNAPVTEHPSTSHISVVDAEGNAVSMTNSIEYAFGSGVMAAGFFLNNELTDFSFIPEENGKEVANRIEPGKRPRSSMTPALVFDDAGALKLVVGSPGGSRIISFVFQTLLLSLEWGLNINEAIDAPHFAFAGGPLELEKNTPLADLAAPLRAMGHDVAVTDETSGLHAIEIRNGELIGAADGRREGEAVGR
ncbi:MAG: gamma-glutamyltransferase [Rickettsiales bacterium]